MKKILFSNMPWWTADEGYLRIGVRAGSRWPFTRASVHKPDDFQFGGYLPVPFFLASAAAYAARTLPHSVVLRDSIARGESYKVFQEYLAELKPDWLVIESATPCWEHDKAMLESIKALLPDIRIIITGTIVAGCDFKKPGSVFAACKGEYEKNVVKVIEHDIGGVLEFDLLTAQEMNDLPYPLFDQACEFNYADGRPTGQRFPQLQVLTSRGCPYKCVFCCWPATMTGSDPDGNSPRKVRFHSPAWVEGMLNDRIARANALGRPYQSIYLDDDTLNLQDKHTLAMCEVMKRIGLPWSAMCRADTVRPETWQAMFDAGCFGVKLGFESGSQRVIDQIINKKLNLRAAAATAKSLREIGMTVHGTFTIGLPGETVEEVQMTKDFIQELYDTGCIDSHQLSGTAVIEGTPMANLIHGNQVLAKYPGAKPEGYVAETDGQAKAEHLGKGQLRAQPMP